MRPDLPQCQLPSWSCRRHEANIDALAAATGTSKDRPLEFSRLAYNIQPIAEPIGSSCIDGIT